MTIELKLVPNNPADMEDWSDWPIESFDDRACVCSEVENHMECGIHGQSLDEYKRTHPKLFRADTSAEQEPQQHEAEYWRGIAQQLGLDYFVLSRAARELINHLPTGEYVGLGELRTALKPSAGIPVEELSYLLKNEFTRFAGQVSGNELWCNVARAALAALSQPVTK